MMCLLAAFGVFLLFGTLKFLRVRAFHRHYYGHRCHHRRWRDSYDDHDPLDREPWNGPDVGPYRTPGL